MIVIPELTLPRPFAAIGRHLPQWPHSLALATALNLATSRGLLALDELAMLEGRLVRIRVRDAGSSASIMLRSGRFRVADSAQQAALTLTAPVSAYLQMLARQEDPDTLFFHRRLSIEGDTELGLLAKNLLDRIELPRWLRLQGGDPAG